MSSIIDYENKSFDEKIALLKEKINEGNQKAINDEIKLLTTLKYLYAFHKRCSFHNLIVTEKKDAKPETIKEYTKEKLETVKMLKEIISELNDVEPVEDYLTSFFDFLEYIFQTSLIEFNECQRISKTHKTALNITSAIRTNIDELKQSLFHEEEELILSSPDSNSQTKVFINKLNELIEKFKFQIAKNKLEELIEIATKKIQSDKDNTEDYYNLLYEIIEEYLTKNEALLSQKPITIADEIIEEISLYRINYLRMIKAQNREEVASLHSALISNKKGGRKIKKTLKKACNK
jgi:hypothetical protein